MSRVSDAARSIGLPRLHLGGSSSSIVGAEVVGQREQRELGARERVGGEHAPSPGGGEHRDVGTARERLGGEGGSRVERLLDGRREVHPGLPAHAGEDAFVARERAGVRRRRAPAAVGRSAVHEDERLLAGGAAKGLEQRPAVAHALEVREPHVGRGIGGEVLEIVGDAHRGGVARRHGAAHADAAPDGEVLEARHDVPRLARDSDAARRRVRGDHLRAERRRRGHDALPVGAGEQDADFLGDRRELGFGAAAVVTRFRVAARHHERRTHSFRAAQARSSSPLTSIGVHTNTRSAAPSGMQSTPVCAVTPRISPPSMLVAKTRPAYACRRMLCKTTKPNLPGCDDAPATITPAGSNSAANRLTSRAFTSSRRARRPRPACRRRR